MLYFISCSSKLLYLVTASLLNPIKLTLMVLVLGLIDNDIQTLHQFSAWKNINNDVPKLTQTTKENNETRE